MPFSSCNLGIRRHDPFEASRAPVLLPPLAARRSSPQSVRPTSRGKRWACSTATASRGSQAPSPASCAARLRSTRSCRPPTATWCPPTSLPRTLTTPATETPIRCAGQLSQSVSPRAAAAAAAEGAADAAADARASYAVRCSPLCCITPTPCSAGVQQACGHHRLAGQERREGGLCAGHRRRHGHAGALHARGGCWCQCGCGCDCCGGLLQDTQRCRFWWRKRIPERQRTANCTGA